MSGRHPTQNNGNADHRRTRRRRGYRYGLSGEYTLMGTPIASRISERAPTNLHLRIAIALTSAHIYMFLIVCPANFVLVRG
jgi:hypothetical protein